MMKKFMSMLLACVLVLGLIPAVSAADTGIDREALASAQAPATQSVDVMSYVGVATLDVENEILQESSSNDDIAHADVIKNNQMYTGTMGGLDVDIYTFTLSKIYDVAIVSGAEQYSMLMGLYDSTGENLIAVGDDGGLDGGVYLDVMYYTLPAGTYYVAVLDEYENTAEYVYLLYLLTEDHTHVWDEGVVTTDPTYTTTGVKTYTCANCLETKTEVVPVVPHEHVYTVTTVEPGCVYDGYDKHVCDICGYSYITDKVESLGHVWEDRVCSRCDVKWEEQFIDVPADKYYYNAVMWAVENGITAGNGEINTFMPKDGCTRGQVVTFLWRAAGMPEPESTEHPFTDVEEGRYYYTAMLWAVENNITTGTTETTFSPNETCTRAQVATFLYRYDGEQKVEGVENPFEDVEADDFCFDAVLWAVENGITTGKTETTFAPDESCTRAQTVTLLYRYMVGE